MKQLDELGDVEGELSDEALENSFEDGASEEEEDDEESEDEPSVENEEEPDSPDSQLLVSRGPDGQ